MSLWHQNHVPTSFWSHSDLAKYIYWVVCPLGINHNDQWSKSKLWSSINLNHINIIIVTNTVIIIIITTITTITTTTTITIIIIICILICVCDPSSSLHGALIAIPSGYLKTMCALHVTSEIKICIYNESHSKLLETTVLANQVASPTNKICIKFQI